MCTHAEFPKIYSFSTLFDEGSAACSQLSKSAKYICKTPVGSEVEGNIIRDCLIQCNDIWYNGDRNENAGDGFEEDKVGEKGKDIDGISRSSGIPHMFLDQPCS